MFNYLEKIRKFEADFGYVPFIRNKERYESEALDNF